MSVNHNHLARSTFHVARGQKFLVDCSALLCNINALTTASDACIAFCLNLSSSACDTHVSRLALL